MHYKKEMRKEEIFKKIQQIIKEQFEISPENVNMETSLSFGKADSLELESLQIVSLIVFVEDTFNIIIDYDVLFNTIEDIVLYVYEQNS